MQSKVAVTGVAAALLLVGVAGCAHDPMPGREQPRGHPVGPFARDDPAEAEIYEWFANRTGNRGDGDADGLACE